MRSLWLVVALKQSAQNVYSSNPILQREIVRGPPIFGLKEAMFMPANKLHITINVMALMDDEDRNLACQLLNECVENVIR